MLIDTLIDTLVAFRAKRGNIEVTVADPTRPMGEDGTVPWTESFAVGGAKADRADGTESIEIIMLIPHPEFLSMTEEQRKELFEP